MDLSQSDLLTQMYHARMTSIRAPHFLLGAYCQLIKPFCSLTYVTRLWCQVSGSSDKLVVVISWLVLSCLSDDFIDLTMYPFFYELTYA